MNSYKTFLMREKAEGGGQYEKLVDIKDYPDLFPSPEGLETTTLSDRARTYEEGIEETEAMEFTSNYTKETFATLRGLKGQELNLAIWFGGTEQDDGTTTPTGEDGKFKCKGKISASIVGKGVNEVREMLVKLTPTSPLVEDEGE